MATAVVTVHDSPAYLWEARTTRWLVWIGPVYVAAKGDISIIARRRCGSGA